MSALFLVGLLLLVTLFLPWINLFRISSLNNEIDRLRSIIRNMDGNLLPPEQEEEITEEKEPFFTKPKPISYYIDQKEKETYHDVPAPEETPLPATPSSSVPRSAAPLETSEKATSRVYSEKLEKSSDKKKSSNSFETNLATKLPVWIGAVSLICAAFFLIKYSIELGWLGPAVRLSLGALFGGVLVVAGQWVAKREHIANSVRIAQGLVGAGLVTLYVSIYAAVHLYEFVSPVSGFCGMAVITATAVILSLRHGQPIAVFGLLGGLLTPLLIGSDEPNAIAMFAYLFVLFTGMFGVLVRRGWWSLAITSLIGVFGWSAFWFAMAFESADAFVLVAFALALSIVVLIVTGKRILADALPDEDKAAIHSLNFTAIAGGVLTIIWLSTEISLTLFDWSMLGLLSVAMMVLAYFQPTVYQKPLLVKLGISLILFAVWVQDAIPLEALGVITGMIAIYVVGSVFIMRTVQDPRFWAVLQTITVLALYLISYFMMTLPPIFIESFFMFWGALALLATGIIINEVDNIQKNYKGDALIKEHLIGIYALAASAFITSGLMIELPWDYIPLAVAGQIAATAWIYKTLKIDSFKIIVLILSLLFVAINYEQIMLFGHLIINSIFDEGISKRVLRSYVLDMPIISLGLSSLLMSFSLWVLAKMDKNDLRVIPILFTIVVALVTATAYYAFRELFHMGEDNALLIPAGFIERGVLTMLCAGAGVFFIQMADRLNIAGLRNGGVALLAFGLVRYVYFDLFLLNPFWNDSQFVGDMPLFNGVTLTYGSALLLVSWAALNPQLFVRNKLYKILALISLFAFSTFTVRQYFHGGDMANGAIKSAEMYCYSVVWLFSGLALLALGIKVKNKMIRMASLAFVLLSILKVFLFDAAELEGLYRILSFFGLGVSLIGLSYFYTKFILNSEKEEREQS